MIRSLKSASLVVLAGMAPFAASQAAPGDYPYYHGDAGGTHYSRLTQINPGNVGRMKEVWRYDLGRESQLQNTPIMVDGVLYGAAIGKMFALDAATGKEKWSFTPDLPQKSRTGFKSRGESWWTDGKTSRLLVTAANYVYSLDPATGQPDPAFGSGGRIDLNDNLRGPASGNYVRMGGAVSVWHDLFITSGEVGEQTPASPGDIRAWDVKTGKLVWTFHPSPIPASRARRPGRKVPGRRPAAQMPGPARCWTKSAALSSPPPVRPRTIFMVASGKAIISMPTA